MSASRQHQALPRYQKMNDPSGTSMPTSSLVEHPIREVPPFDAGSSSADEKPRFKKHEDPPEDPPADRYDSMEEVDPVAQQGPSIIVQREGDDEGAVSSQAAFFQTPSDKLKPSRASHQSHQTLQTHLTASTRSGPEYKDQVRSGSVVADPNPNNIDLNNIVFAENVRAVPASVTVNESHSQDEENAAQPPLEIPTPSKKAPVPQEEGAHRCSKRTLIIVAVAFVVMIAAVVGGVVGSGGRGSNNKSALEGPNTTEVPSIAPTPSVVTGAPTTEQANAMVNFVTSIKLSDTAIGHPLSAEIPEEAAIIWLLENTNLSVGNPSSEFRLRQKYALLVLYYATNGVSWTNNVGWLDPNTDECDWNGITTCDRVFVDGNPENVVTQIQLNDNNLDGDFPADIALLQGLNLLYLHDNPNLVGQIPTATGLLSSIENFSIGNCSMSGLLPEVMSNWSNLREVRGMQWWLYLESLSLFCWLTYIPHSQFWVYQNDFTGTISETFSAWTNLDTFQVWENHLTGSLPNTIGAWSNMDRFGIHTNDINGSIPDTLGTWTALTLFHAWTNGFSSSLPVTIENWHQLVDFSVSNNFLEGSLPEFIGEWTNLSEVRRLLWLEVVFQCSSA